MWIFADFGLLMPAAAPMDEADPKFTEGKYDLQVRGRVADHLRYFMDNYMEPGTFHDEIEETPQMDYNVRFYTTNEAFAQGLSKSVLEIDYMKFKPMAERKDADGFLKFSWGKAYHSVLNSIWSDVLRLAPAGGFYGPKSASNPDGYDFSSNYKGTGSWYNHSYKPRSSSGYSMAQRLLHDDEDIQTLGHAWDEDMPDYTPEREELIEEILYSLRDIPTDQWQSMTIEYDWDLIKDIAAARLKKEAKADKKSARRFLRNNKNTKRRAPAHRR